MRLSGPLARAIGEQLAGMSLSPRHAHYTGFNDPRHGIIDSGLAVFFPAPRSFTGEDVVELQGHGGPVVMDLLLSACVAAGARLARPGEFSERAFLNDKLDLVQAEAIADLVASGTESAARAAQRSLEGAFSDRAQAVQTTLTELRAFIEKYLGWLTLAGGLALVGGFAAVKYLF